MAESTHPIIEILREDSRYKLEAYQFVRESLSYAQEGMGVTESVPSSQTRADDRHLTGQQLCEASRRYALEQYGLMARTVLKSWGIQRTDDLGEIVYNLIRAQLMKKSEHDRREDFDSVFDFETGFDHEYKFAAPEDDEI